MFRQLSVRGVIIDGPKHVARLARRAGTLSREDVDRLCRDLASSFPAA